MLRAETLPYGIPFRERVDAGLRVGEFDSVWTWAPGTKDVVVPADENPDGYFSVDEDEILQFADIVGARSAMASPWAPKSAPHTTRSASDRLLERIAERYAGLCDRAARHALLVQLEFLPWTLVPDLATASEIVRLADRRNDGIVIDAWHLFRTATDPAVVKSVPGHRIIALLLAELLRVLRELDAPAPNGVEVFSDDLHRLGAHEAARRGEALAPRRGGPGDPRRRLTTEAQAGFAQAAEGAEFDIGYIPAMTCFTKAVSTSRSVTTANARAWCLTRWCRRASVVDRRSHRLVNAVEAAGGARRQGQETGARQAWASRALARERDRSRTTAGRAASSY